MCEIRNLLIVDDCPEDRAYLKRLLTAADNEKWVFSEARTIENALTLCRNNQFHCVILDQRLPDGKGIDMLNQLRGPSGDLNVPVVLLTAVGDEVLAADAMKAGALDYVPKRGLTERIITHSICQAIEKFELIQQRLYSEEQLRRSNEELKMFAHIIAHDLQAPLRTVGAMTQLLEMKTNAQSDEETRSLRTFVRTGVRRMSSLIDDLLQFSSLDDPDRPPLGLLNVADSVDWAIQNLRAPIEESHAAIVIQKDLPAVIADMQLRQVFQNLIGNAIKYRAKDRTPEVHISAEPEGNDWVIAVTDNGIGFEMKHAERIFGVLQRLHPADVYEGTGIGLAICKRIIHRYQGQMWVESKPGEGSTFYFRLPANLPSGQ